MQLAAKWCNRIENSMLKTSVDDVILGIWLKLGKTRFRTKICDPKTKQMFTVSKKTKLMLHCEVLNFQTLVHNLARSIFVFRNIVFAVNSITLG